MGKEYYVVYIDKEGNRQEAVFDKPYKVDIRFRDVKEIVAISEGITILKCENNLLETLPELPESLQELHCDGNQLKELLPLPPELEKLYCAENNLESLPDLPEYLGILHCGDNKLRELPNLPENLVSLYCFYNNLTLLPDLPPYLENLYCEHNSNLEGVIYLDVIKYIEDIDIRDTKLILKWDGTPLPNLKELRLNNTIANLRVAKQLKKDNFTLQVRID